MSSRGVGVAAAVLHLLPLCLPPYVLTLGAVHGLARGGPVDALVGTSIRAAADGVLHGPWGWIGLQVLALTPLVTLLVTAAVRASDPAPVEAAALSRGPVAALWRVVAWPAVPAQATRPPGRRRLTPASPSRVSALR